MNRIINMYDVNRNGSRKHAKVTFVMARVA